MTCSLYDPCGGILRVEFETRDFTLRSCLNSHHFREEHPQPEEQKIPDRTCAFCGEGGLEGKQTIHPQCRNEHRSSLRRDAAQCEICHKRMATGQGRTHRTCLRLRPDRVAHRRGSAERRREQQKAYDRARRAVKAHGRRKVSP